VLSADWWHYELQRKETINATHEELIWFMGSNNSLLEVKFTMNSWAISETYVFTGGDQKT